MWTRILWRKFVGFVDFMFINNCKHGLTKQHTLVSLKMWTWMVWWQMAPYALRSTSLRGNQIQTVNLWKRHSIYRYFSLYVFILYICYIIYIRYYYNILYYIIVLIYYIIYVLYYIILYYIVLYYVIYIIPYSSFFSSKVIIGKEINKKNASRHLPAQSQQWKHQNNV